MGHPTLGPPPHPESWLSFLRGNHSVFSQGKWNELEVGLFHLFEEGLAYHIEHCLSFPLSSVCIMVQEGFILHSFSTEASNNRCQTSKWWRQILTCRTSQGSSESTFLNFFANFKGTRVESRKKRGGGIYEKFLKRESSYTVSPPSLPKYPGMRGSWPPMPRLVSQETAQRACFVAWVSQGGLKRSVSRMQLNALG